MRVMDEMPDTEHLKEIRELLRCLLAPKSLEEEVGGIQDRGLGSRRKPVRGTTRGATATALAR